MRVERKGPENAGGKGASIVLPITEEHEVHEIKPVQLTYL